MSVENDQFRNYLGTVITWNLYLISTTALFLAQQKKEMIRKRNVAICMVQVVSVFGASNVWLAKLLFWPQVSVSVPWLLLLAANYFFAISWQLSYYLRAIILLNEYYTNRLGAIINNRLINMEIILRELGLNRAERLIFALQRKIVDTGFYRSDSKRQDRYQLIQETGIQTTFGLRTVMKCVCWTLLFECLLYLMVIGYTSGFTAAALNPRFSAYGRDWIPMYIFSGIYFLLLPYFLYVLRNVQDSFYMRLEQTIVLATYAPCYALWMLTFLVPAWTKAIWPGPNIWLVFLGVVCHTISIAFPAMYEFLRGRKDQKILLSYTLEAFQKVLNDRSLFSQLKDILAEDFCIENALFYEEYICLFPTDSQNSSYITENPESVHRHVFHIVQTFIAPGSPHELNLTSHARKEIMNAIHDQNFSIEILEPARKEIVQLMYTNTYPRLLKRISAQTGK
ncbi:hypothetical protein BKA69DRAFT_1172963, partial [Paraphysoderma sedebokerense]